jgi:hypothetical protein
LLLSDKSQVRVQRDHIHRTDDEIGMYSMTSYNNPDTTKEKFAFPLDQSLYQPTEEEKSFFKLLTGINDDEDLKQHIITVQTKAYEVLFSFFK